MKTYTINGNKFTTEKAFYKYTEAIFTNDLSWETGRNLDAFADILSGGFGEHDYEETIKVEWTNMRKSKEKLPPKLYQNLVRILENTENVIFEKFPYAK